MNELMNWIDERILDLMRVNDKDMSARMEELLKVKDKAARIEMLERASNENSIR